MKKLNNREEQQLMKLNKEKKKKTDIGFVNNIKNTVAVKINKQQQTYSYSYSFKGIDVISLAKYLPINQKLIFIILLVL